MYCVKPSAFNDLTCHSILLPAAEGTRCDKHGESGPKWCRFGNCVPYGTSGGKDPVNGRWSSWSSWSACSVSCGSGIRNRRRKCNSPPPMYGGEDCYGEKLSVSQCQRRACGSWRDPRQIQCEYLASAQNANYGIAAFYADRWSAVLREWNYRSCRLYCRPQRGMNSYEGIETQVADGTSCAKDGQSFCIDGACRTVGCDGVIDGAKFDQCGVCAGNGSSCELNKFEWREAVRGKHQILTIPKGSTNIKIAQQRASSSASVEVSMSPSESGNDVAQKTVNWRFVQASTDKIAGAEFYFERTHRSRHNVVSPGPTLEQIDLAIEIFRGDNPGFEIEYYNPMSTSQKKNYRWLEQYGQCSQACGGGVQTVTFQCHLVDENNQKTPASSLMCRQKRPQEYHKSCGNNPCPAKWKASSWTPCTKSCGSGKSTRTAQCVQIRLGQQVRLKFLTLFELF